MMNLYEMLDEYTQLKVSIPSYRLGQHIVNKMKLNSELLEMPVDLFYIEDDVEAYKVFLEMCSDYCWDVLDLPIFNG